jgi:hypothetical protein
MKQKLITTAVAAALIAASGSASAVTPEQIRSADPRLINEYYLTGSSTQDALILMGLLDPQGCSPDYSSLDVYIGHGDVVFTCYGRADVGVIDIIHKLTMDSAAGIAAVRDQTPLQYIDFFASDFTDCTMHYRGGYTSWSSCTYARTKAVAPGNALSDADPAFLGQGGSVINGTPLYPLYSLQKTYGVAVTVALRDALQQAQGLTVGSDFAADTPNLPVAAVAGVFNRRLKTAADLGVAGDTTPIYPLRLGSNSATQKIAEAFFFSAGFVQANISATNFVSANVNYNGFSASDATCGTATAAPSASPAPTATPVYAGTIEEDVVNCLNRHNAGHRYAIGNLSMLFNAFANPASLDPSGHIDGNYATGFRYVKLDGYLPTVENVIRGNYEFYAEGGMILLNGPYDNYYVNRPWLFGYGTGHNALFTQWTDLPEGSRTSGLVKPGAAVAASCRGKFAALGTTPDTDPVNFATKNPSGVNVSNAMKPLAVCPPRF